MEIPHELIYVAWAILALLGAIALYVLLNPPVMLKFLMWIASHTVVRFRREGLENMPESGAVLLVSNHISLIDMLLIQSISRRPVRFMVHQEVVDFLPTRFIFWYLGVIKVPSIRRPKAMQRFFQSVQQRLRNGEVLCLFPEGGISGNGGLMKFRSGVAPLLPDDSDVTVIPMRLGMLWGRLLRLDSSRIRYQNPISIPINMSIKIGRPASRDLTAFQFRQLISELGAEAEALPQPGEYPLHTAFVRIARHYPWRTTFCDAAEGPKIRNIEMLVRAALLSRRVRKLPRARYVGVLLPSCTHISATLLGVMLADRTPAIINFSSGAEVALEAARSAGVVSILTSKKFLDKLGWAATPEMVFLEDEALKITEKQKKQMLRMMLFTRWRKIAKRLAPESAFNVGREAALLFSSGSTGKPKAVRLTHRNINCDLWSFWRMILWSKRDRIVGNLPIFHAYGFTVEFAFPAMAGTMVAYIPNPLDGGAIIKAIKKYELTILTATPTFLQGYLRKATGEDLKSLRLVVTGAERLRPELAETFRKMTGGMEIIEGYGCTELSPIVCVNLGTDINKLGKHSHHVGSIGAPLPGIHVRIIDQDTGMEQGPNQPGRMQVKGGIVMKGYLNNPELTARVIQNGYYDTGDIAKMDEDGFVYITGRASRFSKIGGEMVPHETVEHCISNLRKSEAREVAVTGRSDSRRGERLVVFYTPADLDPQAVVEALREQKLPNLWIPKADDFFHVRDLPLLGSGKLDLRKLKVMADDPENFCIPADDSADADAVKEG